MTSQFHLPSASLNNQRPSSPAQTDEMPARGSALTPDTPQEQLPPDRSPGHAPQGTVLGAGHGVADSPPTAGEDDTPRAATLPETASVTPCASPVDSGADGPVASTAPVASTEDAPTAAEIVQPSGDAAHGDPDEDNPLWEDPLPNLASRQRQRKRRNTASKKPASEATRHAFTPQQRLLLLDTWRRSGLPAKDFSALVGISKHTLYKWNQLFEQQGPAGLVDAPRGARRGSRLPDLTRRTILMLKQQHPEWGCQRISDMLLRGPALPASAAAVAYVLREAGYESVHTPTRPHPDKVRRFERARPNQLWQTDLFTFVLKRQNRRVHLVAFMDDHSRYLVAYGLHASASTALVLEVLEAGIASYGPPEEILTDNGPQYVTWRGKSQFSKRLEQRGIRQIVARPRRPQTLGKIERFWGTLWREFLEGAIFLDLADARTRIGHFIDYYNFQRVHRGVDGLVPADRFFAAATDVLRTLKARVAANALELARHGKRPRPFYVTGQVDGQTFSVHAEGERLVLTRPGQPREEIELTSAPTAVAPEDPAAENPDAGANTPTPGPLCPDGSLPPASGEPACDRPPQPGETRLALQPLGDGSEPSARGADVDAVDAEEIGGVQEAEEVDADGEAVVDAINAPDAELPAAAESTSDVAESIIDEARAPADADHAQQPPASSDVPSPTEKPEGGRP
jgi:transposase InsO family protein